MNTPSCSLPWNMTAPCVPSGACMACAMLLALSSNSGPVLNVGGTANSLLRTLCEIHLTGQRTPSPGLGNLRRQACVQPGTGLQIVECLITPLHYGGKPAPDRHGRTRAMAVLGKLLLRLESWWGSMRAAVPGTSEFRCQAE